MRSLGWRFIIVGVLCLVMFIPLMMVSDIVNSRRHYSEDTIRSVGQEWGGEQTISGPQVIIPVNARVKVTELRNVIDEATGLVMRDTETGKNLQKLVEEERIENREPLYVYPDLFDVQLSSETQMRHRGIFQVPVYQAKAKIVTEFPFDRVEATLGEGEFAVWDEATLRLTVSSNRALRGEASLMSEGQEILLEPLGGTAGLSAALPGGKDQSSFDLILGFNGAAELRVSPVGRSSTIQMKSDWPDPSFSGAFLPDGSEISDTGFTANWSIPHLARSLPQISRIDHEPISRRDTSFGVRFYQPNDFYQKAWRAARYGILFVSLTFLTVLLMDMQSKRPVHPVQYLLIGLSQAVFTLLMLAYAEQIGFSMAYLGSAAALILLLVLFGRFALKMGSRTWVLGGMLVLLYAVLYLILYSTDYALLAGATLAFVAIGATMYATRNEEWYGEDGPGTGLFARRAARKAEKQVVPPTAGPKAES
ncbi:cell envelope integrity protein CreD [Aliiroseovarius sp. F20344]|uniref:cell envelope integrity protein CreD n=1 Tax=Aliiroseovarius sp. F20344 TaxID=2926414 RepID=UPI001FF285FD|nr:cell envelope integrity protein CreD [Aliiroseovarius sp. F20344]MCK0143061.1 cell envelope integrity protein CreD [Aliiroseovarius sp. F20344]